MVDVLCMLMGAMDLIAGIIIILTFLSQISTFFGIAMILKGVISLIPMS